MKINILGRGDVRGQGARKITSGTCEMFYCGGTEHERGVTIPLGQDMGKTDKGYWTLSDRV